MGCVVCVIFGQYCLWWADTALLFRSNDTELVKMRICMASSNMRISWDLIMWVDINYVLFVRFIGLTWIVKVRKEQSPSQYAETRCETGTEQNRIKCMQTISRIYIPFFSLIYRMRVLWNKTQDKIIFIEKEVAQYENMRRNHSVGGLWKTQHKPQQQW